LRSDCGGGEEESGLRALPLARTAEDPQGPLIVEAAGHQRPPRFHAVRYAGVLAGASTWRPRITPEPPGRILKHLGLLSPEAKPPPGVSEVVRCRSTMRGARSPLVDRSHASPLASNFLDEAYRAE